MNSIPTPSNAIPSASPNPSPSPKPNTTSIPNCTSFLANSCASPFSSRTIQTPIFNSDESPQLDVGACYSMSSTIQLENSQNLDSSTEMNIIRRGKTQIWPDIKG